MTLIDYPGHVLAAVILLVAAFLIVTAFSEPALRHLRFWRVILGLMRSGAIAILLVIIWNPSLPEITQSSRKNTILVAFDTSRSMSLTEAGSKTRLDEAIDIFQSHFGPVRPDRPSYKIYGFDRSCYYNDSTSSLRRWGRRSRLTEVFRLLGKNDNSSEKDSISSAKTVNQQFSSVVGAVIFTDGQAEDKNLSSYLPKLPKKIKTIIVGIGKVDPHSDIAIDFLRAPGQVMIDTAYKAKATLRGVGLDNERIKIELRKDDYVIAVKELSSEQIEQKTTIEFSVGADKLGSHCLEVRAQGAKNELNLANNLRRTMVNVEEDRRFKVLFYTQVVNFDFGKIRSALERDKKIQLDVGLDVIKGPLLKRKGKSLAGNIELPGNKSGFYQYDLIILGPCDMNQLTPEQVEGLYSFVVERGGGLVLLPGRGEYRPSNWENAKIKTLLPVEFAPDTAAYSLTTESPIMLTHEGIQSRVLSEIDLKERPGIISAFYHNLYEKPAAGTIVRASEKPIVCIHRVGRGRVCLINAYGLFHWYREDVAGGLLQKFVSGLTTYLSKGTSHEAGIELFAKRLPDNTEKIRFDAYIYDRQFSLVAGATTLLEVAGEFFTMEEADKGHYFTELENNSDEAIIATAEAQIGGLFLGRKTLAVNLPLPKGEMDRVELDRDFLRKLAEKTGASYLDAGEIDEKTAEVFDAVTVTKKVTHMRSAWQRWPLLIGLCALLSAIWFIRRAKGLI